MAKKNKIEVHEPQDFTTFDNFLTAIASRTYLRLVKVDDQGLVEPARQGSAFVMQPRVRIVATALDFKTGEILRYQNKWDVGSNRVTVHGFGQGSYNDPTGDKTRARIIAALEARGFSVSSGEWTRESAAAALAA